MENGGITDSQITASSEHSLCPSNRGRLNQIKYVGYNAWCAGKNATGEYIQIDLRTTKTVTKIATQGRYLGIQWVTKYTVAYYCDKANPEWITYTEPGTNDPKVKTSLIYNVKLAGLQSLSS